MAKTESNVVLFNEFVFVGQAPNQSGGKDALAGGAAFRRIATALDMDMDEWLWFARRINLLNYYPGASGKGDEFPMDVAVMAAARIAPALIGFRVVFVGKQVAAAFNIKTEFLRWERSAMWKFDYCVIPHPSGIVTWWNDMENVFKFQQFMRDSVEVLS